MRGQKNSKKKKETRIDKIERIYYPYSASLSSLSQNFLAFPRGGIKFAFPFFQFIANFPSLLSLNFVVLLPSSDDNNTTTTTALCSFLLGEGQKENEISSLYLENLKRACRKFFATVWNGFGHCDVHARAIVLNFDFSFFSTIGYESLLRIDKNLIRFNRSLVHSTTSFVYS